MWEISWERDLGVADGYKGQVRKDSPYPPEQEPRQIGRRWFLARCAAACSLAAGIAVGSWPGLARLGGGGRGGACPCVPWVPWGVSRCVCRVWWHLVWKASPEVARHFGTLLCDERCHGPRWLLLLDPAALRCLSSFLRCNLRKGHTQLRARPCSHGGPWSRLTLFSLPTEYKRSNEPGKPCSLLFWTCGKAELPPAALLGIRQPILPIAHLGHRQASRLKATTPLLCFCRSKLLQGLVGLRHSEPG